MCIISYFNDRMEHVKNGTKEYEMVRELYAQAIRLQCSKTYGYVMVTDDFIHSVKDGYFNDYDGIGRFADEDGNVHEYVYCNPAWLKNNRQQYPYVIWYNK